MDSKTLKDLKDKALRPFDYKEVNDLFDRLFNSLFNESGRGAILIAATLVEEQLTDLIESVLPAGISKENKRKLFNYPGPLSSFAAKINLYYAFRLIGNDLHTSLNTLREIRNNAAHSASNFSLSELNDKLSNIYKLGPDIDFYIKKQAIETLLRSKRYGIEYIFEEHKIPEQERNDKFRELLDKPETIDSLKEQLPFWELLCGLCFICGVIYYQKDRIQYLANLSSTWWQLIDFIEEK